MDRAELSIEISRLVSRALNGETIDVTVEGEGLAVKYPGLGMSGQMIADAIASATGMMGMIRSGNGLAADIAAAAGGAGGRNGEAAAAANAADEPQELQPTEEAIAGALTAGGSSFEAHAEPADAGAGEDESLSGATPAATDPAGGADGGLAAAFSRGAVAFRRALFRA